MEEKEGQESVVNLLGLFLIEQSISFSSSVNSGEERGSK